MNTPSFQVLRLLCCAWVITLFACTQQDPIEKQIDLLLSQMTIEEKIGQMNQVDPSWEAEPKEQLIREGKVGSVFNVVGAKKVNRLQRMAVEETRLGIPLLVARDVIHGYKTIYPIPLGQGATWNPKLIEQASTLTAYEAYQAGIRWTFSPMVDVARDPRWGRVAEGYGEDTYLTSQMGVAAVKGYQQPLAYDTIAANQPLLMAACVKHFAGYSASEGGRDYNTTWIPELMLRDIYLPPFKAALDAGAASIMCSFNNLNGLPSSANPHLNIDILRHEWQSDALLVSDWGSGSDLVPHGLAADKKEAALRCINAQMEMDMQGYIYLDYLKEWLEAGEITEQQIDDCVRSILRLKFRLGLFDNPYVPEEEPSYYREEALAVATEMVEQSAILLKNNGTLPLQHPTSNIQHPTSNILITGPMADQQKEQLGTWVFDGEPEHSITPLTAFRQWADSTHNARIIYEPGLTYSRDKNLSGIAKAVEAAKNADIILFFCGEEAILSGEARCRADLNLPGAQIEMMDALVATGKPIVMIVMAGRPLTIGKQMEQAAAVLYAFHGGTMAGPGLRNVLVGEAVPSGKTTLTFPKMVGQVPLYYNRFNTGRPSYDPPMLIDSIPIGCPQFSIGQSSYWLETPTEALVPFGFGLSYTTFSYSDPIIHIDNTKGTITAACTITNTGTRDAYETAQLYTHQISGAHVRPICELKGFEKVFIPAGESREVEITITKEQLGYWHQTWERDATGTAPATHNFFFATDQAEFELWISPDSRRQTTPVLFRL